MKKATLIMVMFLAACTKVVQPLTPAIDLGIKSQNTGIKSITQVNNTVTAIFETTVGAKYSVQIIPFGSDQPSKKEGFTATETATQKTYSLANLAKKDYDLIFIDIDGKQAKYPITIK
jgi:hypothetical protein